MKNKICEFPFGNGWAVIEREGRRRSGSKWGGGGGGVGAGEKAKTNI